MSDLLIFSHIEESNSFDNLNIEYSESNLNFNNLFGDNKEYEAIVIGNNMTNKKTNLKARKNMQDNMRKKIKSNFYKELKKIVNVKYKDLKFSQKMIINVAKEENKNNLTSSLRDVLIAQKIKENDDILNNISAEDDNIFNKKIKYLFNEYLNSAQFQDSIKNLVDEGELFDYIHKYIQVAENYISFFLKNNDKQIKSIEEFQIFDKAKEEEEDYKSLYSQEPIFVKNVVNIGKRDSERKYHMRKRIRTKFYKFIIKQLNKNKEILQHINNKRYKFQQNMTSDEKNKEIFDLTLEEVLNKNFFKIEEQNNELYDNLIDEDNNDTDLEIKLDMKISEIYEQFYKKGILVKELEKEEEFYDYRYELNNEAKKLLNEN